MTFDMVKLPVKRLASGLEGFKIVHLSDLHLHPFTELSFIEKAIGMVNDLNPDLVAITGDFVSQEAETIFELAPVVARLNPKYGIFSCLGNHEVRTGPDIVTAGLAEVGIPVFANQGRTITVGKAAIYIAGLDDAWLGRPDLRTTLADAPPEAPTILMVHEPDAADRVSLDGRVTLQLSGHSHGGQVRLPGLGALALPPMARKYDQGLYNVNDMWLYTTRGVGVTGLPIRLNCRPEITEITLIGA
ncbi:MAG: metallophosphoesterase [Anaerolineae bacterium]|nr:metallophosphoesterase [Anaerolineae bacterium]